MTRTYVITGTASGIGAATARILVERGERVIGIDVHDADIVADLSTPAGRAEAAARAVEAAGGVVDAVIANAGLSSPTPATLAVNYFGVTELLEALLPALRASAAPRAVVTSSMASLMPNSPELVEAALAGDEASALRIAEGLAADPQLGALIYPSSKRAISRWVRRQSTTADWAGAGIPLNAVGPGIVVTPMTEDLLATPESVRFLDQVVPMPLNGHQSPESIAYSLIWLTSEENSHVTGQTIYNDGGSDVALRGDDVWSWND